MKTQIILLFVTLATCSLLVPTECDKDWWKHAVFYQIYPRSFKDSDGDGVGDLQGIISKLDHLKDAGVTSAWLSPIYKSPQVDAGYDISDFKDIHEEYGTMQDFHELVVKAKELGIKIVMDFVPNHSSNEHDWFKKSENSEAGYEDYYVWADGANNDDITPPNNWLSIWKYSAWQYSPIRKQWYLHQFALQQPDLNYNSPKVVAEMKDVMKFWMDKGVDGFRVDAVPYLFEKGMEDEPLSGDPNASEDDYGYLKHIYTMDQPETYDMIYQFREFIDEYNKEHDGDERIMMTEAYTNITNTMLFYGDGDRLGAHFTFNFQLIPIDSKTNAKEIVAKVKEWMHYMPSQYTPNWVIGNHDNHRVASKVGVENVDGFNMLVSMLPGVAVTYNGEEIGMEDGYVSWEQGEDPSACNGKPEDFNKTSRDFERTPFHWDATKNAGFSTADSTWLPVSEKYVNNNLEQEKGEPNGHYRIYQKLLQLRKESEVLKYGQMEIVAYSDNVLALCRYKEVKNQNQKIEEQNHVLLFNIGDTKEIVNLKEIFGTISQLLKIKISSNNSQGLLISTSIILQAHESVIAESFEF